ncbi:unknown protein [Seminavis robusta]|uniref:Uncharacterized protein n=1 Tax=Seminavis robusta TaxID=568900 RepID=A0A9N8F3D8_9STRA|nr:unknown protein [Seminavis robusta]|eukprot:Sro3078_g343340.1 n/a (117) ;mRNA; f:1059-1409
MLSAWVLTLMATCGALGAQFLNMARCTSSTIIDDATINGHYYDGSGLTVDDVYISGVLHPECFVSAGAVVPGNENGPLKALTRSGETATTTPHYRTPGILSGNAAVVSSVTMEIEV